MNSLLKIQILKGYIHLGSQKAAMLCIFLFKKYMEDGRIFFLFAFRK